LDRAGDWPREARVAILDIPETAAAGFPKKDMRQRSSHGPWLTTQPLRYPDRLAIEGLSRYLVAIDLAGRPGPLRSALRAHDFRLTLTNSTNPGTGRIGLAPCPSCTP